MTRNEREPNSAPGRSGSEGHETMDAGSLAARIGIGVAMLAAAVAVGCLLSSCGSHDEVQSTNGMSHNRSDVVTTPSQPILALPASSTPAVRTPESRPVTVTADSLPPEIAAFVEDTLVTPGQVVTIDAEASLDVTEVVLTDDLGHRQAMHFDDGAGLWRTYYRVPLRVRSERMGFSITARNGAQRWHRVWIFLRIAEEDGCLIPTRTDADRG